MPSKISQIVEYIFAESQSLEVNNILSKGRNDKKVMVITGTISEISVRSTKRGGKLTFGRK